MSSLRSLITDRRPAALDDLGAEAAINALARRMHSRGLDVELRPRPRAHVPGSHSTEA